MYSIRPAIHNFKKNSVLINDITNSVHKEEIEIFNINTLFKTLIFIN